MGVFTDKDGNKITTVTNENLQDFFEFTKKRDGYQSDLYVADDVKLTDLFKDYELKSKEEKSNLMYAVAKTFNRIDDEQDKAFAREKELKKRTEEQRGYVKYLSERKNDNEIDRKELSDAEEWLARDEAGLTKIAEELSVYQKREEEAADLARTNPQAFKDAYESSANNSGYDGFYEIINKVAQENKFSDNLYMINTLIESDCFPDYILKGKEEDVRTLPADKAKILAGLFFDAAAYNQNSKNLREVNAYRMLDNWNNGLLSRGDFLNYEPKNVGGYRMAKPAQIREAINQYIWDIDELDCKLIFDGQKVQTDLLKKAFDRQLQRDSLVAKNGVQEKHDDKEMQRYIDVRQMILDVADKTIDKYIPNTRGEEKTLTQKYKELISGLYGKPYAEIELGAVGKDYLLSAAYADINNGNAAKLEEDSLMLVVQHDPNGYWLQKIAEKEPKVVQDIIQERDYARLFTARQSRVADTIAPEIALEGNKGDIKLGRKAGEYEQGVAASKHMSTTEKEEFLQKAQEYVDEKIVKPAEAFKNVADKFRQDSAQLNDLKNQMQAKEETANFLDALQAKYARIADCYERGDSRENENEKHLRRENAEEVIWGFAHGTILGYPPERPLPLLFGRGKERERREEMRKCIDEFNKTLRDFSNKVQNQNNKWVKYFDLEEIKGKMLQKSTVEQSRREASIMKIQCDQMQQKITEEFGGKFNNDDVKRADKEYELAQQKSQQIKEEKEKLLAKKEKMTEKRAAKKAADKEKSPLKAVTSGMDKNEKAEVRKFNKTIKDSMAR